MPAVYAKILARIRRRNRGNVYTNKDFLDLGSRSAVDRTLSRLVRSGELRRIGRGLYYDPHYSPFFGWGTVPAENVIVGALVRQRGFRIAASGAAAANMLGLSTQVPARLVLATDARTQQIRVGDRVFEFKHVSPKLLPYNSPISALVIQAFRWLGPDAVNAQDIARLRRTMPASARKELLRNAHYAPEWIAARIYEIAAGS